MTDERDTIIFTIALASGQFKSELRFAMPETQEEREAVVLRWMEFIRTGLRIKATEMTANLATSGRLNSAG